MEVDAISTSHTTDSSCCVPCPCLTVPTVFCTCGAALAAAQATGSHPRELGVED